MFVDPAGIWREGDYGPLGLPRFSNLSKGSVCTMDLKNLRPTWAEIDLDAIANNVRELKSAASPGTEMIAVIKADGYGHGAIEVARTALENGASWLAVAVLDEAVQLRQAGLTVPMLILGYIPPAQARRVLEHDLRVAVFHRDLAEALSEAAVSMGKRVSVHVKVDTGMGRIGIAAVNQAVDFIEGVAKFPGIDLEGAFTHFASADEPDKDFTVGQLDKFLSVIDMARARGIHIRIRHAANSAGLIDLPETHLEMVRPGISLYGFYPSEDVSRKVRLIPAMTWKTRVSFVKRIGPGTPVSYGRTYKAQEEETIITLPVGYADGFSRAWSNRGQVLLGGEKHAIVGRVCMDQIMARVRGGLVPEVGQEVVLMGRQGGQEISGDDLAMGLGTINYEIVCLVGKRVPRVYLKGGQVVRVTIAGAY